MVAVLLVLAMIPYAILKYACRKPMPRLIHYLFYIFLFWTWIFCIFETPSKRREKLRKAGVKEGQVILDLGCGPGRFTILAAKTAGPEGKVYALDIHYFHTAVTALRVAMGGHKNITVIRADCCVTHLTDKSIDLIFINDAFHEFDQVGCLKEAARILKPDGILAIYEEEVKEAKLLSVIERSNLFTIVEREKRLYKLRPLREG